MNFRAGGGIFWLARINTRAGIPEGKSRVIDLTLGVSGQTVVTTIMKTCESDRI